MLQLPQSPVDPRLGPIEPGLPQLPQQTISSYVGRSPFDTGCSVTAGGVGEKVSVVIIEVGLGGVVGLKTVAQLLTFN